MSEAKEIWEGITEKNIITDSESGHPAEPSSTNFKREMPLYVDFDYSVNEWSDPQIKRGSLAKGPRIYEIEVANNELAQIEKTQRLKLYDANSLLIINNVFKKQFCNISIAASKITGLYDKVGDILRGKDIASIADFKNSSMFNWPLYHFAGKHGRNR